MHLRPALRRYHLKLLALLLAGGACPASAQNPAAPSLKYKVPPYTLVAPELKGSYQSAKGLGHPFVFTSKAELERLLADKTPASVKALARLETNVRMLTEHKADIKPAYAGCDLDRYIAEFAYGKGATQLVPQLAMYAYLTSLKQGYGDPALAAGAGDLAHTIMLDWARNGIRNDGRFRDLPSDYCPGPGQTTPNAIVYHLVALQMGRGMPMWVDAQDLLVPLNVFTSAELVELNTFLRNMFALIVKTSNNKTLTEERDCDRFNNQVSASLAGLAAIARFKDDGPTLEAIARGTGPAARQILLPWTNQLQGNIYGDNDPMRGCYPLTDAVPMSNYYQLATTAKGEVEDRFRGHADQPFGYGLGSLALLMETAQILQSSGFDAYGYVANKGQSMRSALDYYAYYFTKFLDIKDTVVPDAKDPYPDYQQYVGHPTAHGDTVVTGVNGLLTPYVLALREYPDDPYVSAVLGKALSFKDRVTPLYGVDMLALPDLPLLKTLPPAPPALFERAK